MGGGSRQEAGAGFPTIFSHRTAPFVSVFNFKHVQRKFCLEKKSHHIDSSIVTNVQIWWGVVMMGTAMHVWVAEDIKEISVPSS